LKMTKTLTMPERRPGQETITIFLPSELKEDFKRLCSLKGTTMTEEIKRYVAEAVEENRELLNIVEQGLKSVQSH